MDRKGLSVAEVVAVRGVLFDMDGVLVSSIGSAERCWRAWAAHYGLPNADQVTIPHGTRALDIALMLKPDVDPVEGLRRIEEMEIADAGDLKVLPGAKELLESLPVERWAIVTSATKPLLIARLGAAGLPVPERLVSGEMVQRGKPDPEPYRMGATMVGAAPADCLVVEDAPNGVQSGVRAGCRVLGVEGTHTAAELRQAGAEFVVTSLERIRATVQGDRLAVEFL